MKSVRLKDKVLRLYAAYSMCSMFQMESSEAFDHVLDLSNKLKENKFS